MTDTGSTGPDPFTLNPNDTVLRRLTSVTTALDADRPTNIGFPGAVDIDFGPVLPLCARMINNIGDPYVDGTGSANTKDLEREVVHFFAELFRAPSDDRWGYVTTGGTEGNEFGLYAARTLLPDAPVYFSEASHYSIVKLLAKLRMPAVRVRATATGHLDLDHLAQLAAQPSGRTAIVLANVGTTMTEAVDDVARIKEVLRAAGRTDHYVHADAALAGVPLALTWPRPAFDMADGADSISISGHKFLGVPFPCGVLVTRQTLTTGIGQEVAYTGTPDTTLAGSRNGHAAAFLWYVLNHLGLAGLHRRVSAARGLAAHLLDRLTAVGWEAWRNPLAFTVVLRTPPQPVTQRWALAHSGTGWSHVVCAPGVTRAQVDAFVDDLVAARDRRRGARRAEQPAEGQHADRRHPEGRHAALAPAGRHGVNGQDVAGRHGVNGQDVVGRGGGGGGGVPRPRRSAQARVRTRGEDELVSGDGGGHERLGHEPAWALDPVPLA